MNYSEFTQYEVIDMQTVFRCSITNESNEAITPIHLTNNKHLNFQILICYYQTYMMSA